MATSGDAELLLIPRVDYEEMRRTANRMADALERATEQAVAEMQRDLRRGVGRGINQGINDGEMGFSKLKLGLASIAVSAGSLIKDSMEKTLGGADETLGKILERAEKIKAVMGQSSALGVDQGNYAAWSIASMGKGVEQDDLLGMFSGFSEGLNDDKLTLYKNIRDKNGLEEAFFRMIYTGSTMSADKAHTWFADDATLGSDANFANKLADIMRDMRANNVDITKESFFKYAGVKSSTATLSDDLNNSKSSLNLMNKTDQGRFESAINKGLSQVEDQAYTNRMRSIDALDQAHIDNITLKVTTANFQDKMEIKQLDATIKTMNLLSKGVGEINATIDEKIIPSKKINYDNLSDDPRNMVNLLNVADDMGYSSPAIAMIGIKLWHDILKSLNVISEKVTPDKHKQNTDNNNAVTGKD